VDEKRTRKLIDERWCPQYMTQAKLYIETGRGRRTLVIDYEEGSFRDLLVFKTGIPDDWTIDDVMRVIESPGSKIYPAWEIPARIYGSPILMKPKT
jgi:hypothetical protein